MGTTFPNRGTCPKCGGEFRILRREAFDMGTHRATDQLEWRCTSCGYETSESRRLQDGQWSESRYADD